MFHIYSTPTELHKKSIIKPNVPANHTLFGQMGLPLSQNKLAGLAKIARDVRSAKKGQGL